MLYSTAYTYNVSSWFLVQILEKTFIINFLLLGNIIWQVRPMRFISGSLCVCFFNVDIVFANNTGLFERLSTPRTSRTSITQPNSPPMPKHDVVVITQSGVYPQDKIDHDFEVNNEALDIAATQVCIQYAAFLNNKYVLSDVFVCNIAVYF